MRCLVLCCFVSACWAQSTTYAPVLASAGYLNPSLLPVAPGQLLTLFVQPAPSDANPTVSAVFWNGSDQPMPVQQVQRVGVCPSLSNPSCAQSLAVTVEIPFGIPVLCPLCENPIQAQGSIAVSVNGVKSSYVDVQPLQDQVHFLTACDIVVSGSATPLLYSTGLPCSPIITHPDGTAVSAIRPALAGEELVAYATGLGQTNPPLTTGQPAAASTPTVTAFNVDFNYRPNALATKPGAVGAPVAAALFTGATKGYIGLYQINFVVPPPPAGLSPCVDFTAIPLGGNVVQSNLTVSVGSNYSFDGAGICVEPSGTAQPLSQ